jgi:1,4-dihydroxy-2-naphthoate octaprenyltransferase
MVTNKGTSPISAWILGSRPKTLTAAIAPILIGVAIAIHEGQFLPLPALAALWCSIFIQVGTNYYNDFSDYVRGVDTAERLGPIRVTQAGLLSPGQVRSGAMIAFGLAGIAGLYLVVLWGWPVVLIGLGSILAGLAYTAGPSPLAYNGLGDLFTLIFFGYVATLGTVYVQLGEIPGLAWPAATGMGVVITALLVVNNVRDIETDQAAGRRTIPVRFGRKVGVIEFVLLLGIAMVMPVVQWVGGEVSLWILLPWVTFPWAIHLSRCLWEDRGKALNRTLAGSARYLLVYAALLSLGLLL